MPELAATTTLPMQTVSIDAAASNDTVPPTTTVPRSTDAAAGTAAAAAAPAPPQPLPVAAAATTKKKHVSSLLPPTITVPRDKKWLKRGVSPLYFCSEVTQIKSHHKRILIGQAKAKRVCLLTYKRLYLFRPDSATIFADKLLSNVKTLVRVGQTQLGLVFSSGEDMLLQFAHVLVRDNAVSTLLKLCVANLGNDAAVLPTLASLINAGTAADVLRLTPDDVVCPTDLSAYLKKEPLPASLHAHDVAAEQRAADRRGSSRRLASSSSLLRRSDSAVSQRARGAGGGRQRRRTRSFDSGLSLGSAGQYVDTDEEGEEDEESAESEEEDEDDVVSDGGFGGGAASDVSSTWMPPPPSSAGSLRRDPSSPLDGALLRREPSRSQSPVGREADGGDGRRRGRSSSGRKPRSHSRGVSFDYSRERKRASSSSRGGGGGGGRMLSCGAFVPIWEYEDVKRKCDELEQVVGDLRSDMRSAADSWQEMRRAALTNSEALRQQCEAEKLLALQQQIRLLTSQNAALHSENASLKIQLSSAAGTAALSPTLLHRQAAHLTYATPGQPFYSTGATSAGTKVDGATPHGAQSPYVAHPPPTTTTTQQVPQ